MLSERTRTAYGSKWSTKKQKHVSTSAVRELKRSVRYYTRNLASPEPVGYGKTNQKLAKTPANAARRKKRAHQIKALRGLVGKHKGISSISPAYHGSRGSAPKQLLHV